MNNKHFYEVLPILTVIALVLVGLWLGAREALQYLGFAGKIWQVVLGSAATIMVGILLIVGVLLIRRH